MASGRWKDLAAATIALAVLLVLFLPSTAPAIPSIDATRTRHLPLRHGLLRGPESVAFDAKASPTAACSSGTATPSAGRRTAMAPATAARRICIAITRRRPSKATADASSVCASTSKSGYLYVADAYKGLMRVAPGGREATVLITEVDGVPLRFTNGVDIDQVTGEVYFTDSSRNYDRSQHEMVTRTGDSTGRLIRYDPRTGKAVVLQDDITYPNGLAISADRTHLVISSTGPCKLLRYWIKGSKAGTMEIFVDLPGYPDNIRPDKKGGYWVVLHLEKAELPFGVDSHLLALRIDSEGRIIEEMRRPKSVRPTEVVERKGGRLFMGSVELPYVAVVTRK
ncbi:hypothetical protein ZWY2020_050353 [Hordeum vulgare]|nr:hypothetical protein ZWY2020_050353 [Hordeum vulgare]